MLVDTFGRANFGFTRFSYADTALSIRGDTAWAKVRNSTFNHFNTLAVYSKSAKTDLGDKNVSPTNCGKNNFFMSTASLGAKAVVKDSTPGGTLHAEGNWWDSTSPSASWFVGSVDYSPYLHAAATKDSCPAGGGGGGCGGGEQLCSEVVKDAPRPLIYSLSQNYPNPFNAGTVIRFSLPQATRVELRIYNILGQVVRSMADEKPLGVYEVLWDGRDGNGVPVSSGLYLYQIRARDFVETKKMQLVK